MATGQNLELLRRLGGLHDARIEEVVWRKADRSLRLIVEDMLSNVEGLPDYKGPASGSVTLIGIENAAVETGVFRGVFLISGIDVEERDGALDVRIGLREPGADVRLRCKDIAISIANAAR